ncbi:MAG: ABC transporter ATP-binding protein [Chloroflexota bacterium]|nr:ABC transporter ATP-binding protein [Chloroflexota bacterium]MDE3102242.1 ABC transporter ATP-binding protein [Chloroflexota bacterium]
MTREGAGPLLEVRGVAHSYGGVQAVAGVDLDVQRGEFLGLIGPNGAGKTTLLDLISGAVRPERGRVVFNGHDITRKPLHAVARLGLVRTFQTARVFARMTVLSNLMSAPAGQRGEGLLASVFGGWRDQERTQLGDAREMLQRFRIADAADQLGSELSGGQRRLTELSRTLMAGPTMLLLDEPFAGVSPTNRARLAAHLRALSVERGITILMIEHRLDLVEQLCGRIVVMAEGRAIAEGTMGDLRRNAAVVSAYLGEVSARAG